MTFSHTQQQTPFTRNAINEKHNFNERSCDKKWKPNFKQSKMMKKKTWRYTFYHRWRRNVSFYFDTWKIFPREVFNNFTSLSPMCFHHKRKLFSYYFFFFVSFLLPYLKCRWFSISDPPFFRKQKIKREIFDIACAGNTLTFHFYFTKSFVLLLLKCIFLVSHPLADAENHLFFLRVTKKKQK